jgi:hypothetical protein
MAMDRINGSPLLRQNQIDRFQGSERPRGDSGAGEAAGAPPASGAEIDRAEISDTARKLVDLRQAVMVGRSALGGLPDVREDRVAQVRERLAMGYYQSAEVTSKVAEKVAGVVGAMGEL